ncbi:MAG: HIT family protein [bacterium]|nr:HIT family protein [bacterium]
MKCLFCSISKKEIGSEVIYEDEDVFAFLDISPRAPGHTMVISKIHSETMLDLSDEALAPLFKGVKEVTARLEAALKPDGFTIGINHGQASGQVVEHLHVHIIPRFEGDGGGSIHSVVSNPPRESLEEIAAKIRAAR